MVNAKSKQLFHAVPLHFHTTLKVYQDFSYNNGRMMHYKAAIALLCVGLIICVQPSLEQDADSVQLFYPVKPERGVMSSNVCGARKYYGNCKDIRRCKYAAASIAMGGFPPVCGWMVDNVMPKVCCGELSLGRGLLRKAEREIERGSDCGLAVWQEKISPTKINFRKLYRDLPNVNPCDDLSRYDPPLDIDCSSGVSPAGGKSVDQGTYPWMVAVMANGKHICGGSIIDRTHVLSAAHCFTSGNGRSNKLRPRSNISMSRKTRFTRRRTRGILNTIHYEVHAGDIHLYNGSAINVKRILIHEKYIPGQYYHDIAILFLEKEVHPSLRPICLPSPKLALKNLAGENTTILGWGHTSYRGAGTNVLQEVVDIPVVTTEECRRAYPPRLISRRELPYGITNDFICAGLEEGGKDACQSDSGGPLMYNPIDDPNDTKWVLVGIVSFGFRCAEPGIPGVYTRVSTHMSWILQNTKD